MKSGWFSFKFINSYKVGDSMMYLNIYQDRKLSSLADRYNNDLQFSYHKDLMYYRFNNKMVVQDIKSYTEVTRMLKLRDI